MKTIQYTDKVLEHIPEKVAAIKRANDRLTRLLPAEHFKCIPLSTRMTRVACAKSWHASPRASTGANGNRGNAQPQSATMRPANGCASCAVGEAHYRGRVPDNVPAVEPLRPHASAGTSTSTATMRRDLGITANKSHRRGAR